MKKVTFSMLVLFLSLLFASCQSVQVDKSFSEQKMKGSDTSEKQLNENKSHVNENIYLQIGIEPLRDIEGQGTEYESYVFFTNRNDSAQDGEFENAVITINGIQMTLEGIDFFRINKGAGLFLDEGDTVTVQIEHELTGTIEKELTVPESIQTFTTVPALVFDKVNESDTYEMIWKQWNCDAYSIRIERSSGNRPLDSFGSLETELSYIWDSYYLKEENNVIPYIRFNLLAANKADLETLARGSVIHVCAPEAAVLGNY